jgi:hypothetical protein
MFDRRCHRFGGQIATANRHVCKKSFKRSQNQFNCLTTKLFLQTRFKEEMEEKQTRLQAEVSELKAQITGLEAQLHRQESIITTLQYPTQFTQKSVNDIQPKLINGMPNSCGDLWSLGHIWSGLYSIMGINMVETVYCDFSKISENPGKSKIDLNSTPTSQPRTILTQLIFQFRSSDRTEMDRL